MSKRAFFIFELREQHPRRGFDVGLDDHDFFNHVAVVILLHLANVHGTTFTQVHILLHELGIVFTRHLGVADLDRGIVAITFNTERVGLAIIGRVDDSSATETPVVRRNLISLHASMAVSLVPADAVCASVGRAATTISTVDERRPETVDRRLQAIPVRGWHVRGSSQGRLCGFDRRSRGCNVRCRGIVIQASDRCGCRHDRRRSALRVRKCVLDALEVVPATCAITLSGRFVAV